MTAIKKSGLQRQSRLSLQEAFKCGDCLHFKQFPHPAHKEVCSGLGVKSFGLAPVCFTPDYTKIVSNVDEFIALSALFSQKTQQQKKIMLGMLRQKCGPNRMEIGTLVFMNVRGREYIDNYYCAYVIGYTSAGQIVLAGTPTTLRGRTFFAYLRNDQSLMTPTRWAKRFQTLKAKGRITDPANKVVRDITALVLADDYEIPNIDSMPRAPEDMPSKKRSLRTTPLTELAAFSF